MVRLRQDGTPARHRSLSAQPDTVENVNTSSLPDTVESEDASPAGVVASGTVASDAPRPFALDASQQAAIALPDGLSCSVIGAPGTGKTSTLIELVADRVLGRCAWERARA